MPNQTRNALAAGATAGSVAAIATPGAIGVAAAGKAVKIPVVTQVITLGTAAACIAALATAKSKETKDRAAKGLAMAIVVGAFV